MALEVKRKEKEPVQNLVRRFSRAVQESGILRRARERAFRVREKSRDLKREAALRREALKKEYEKLRKLGKIP